MTFKRGDLLEQRDKKKNSEIEDSTSVINCWFKNNVLHMGKILKYHISLMNFKCQQWLYSALRSNWD